MTEQAKLELLQAHAAISVSIQFVKQVFQLLNESHNSSALVHLLVPVRALCVSCPNSHCLGPTQMCLPKDSPLSTSGRPLNFLIPQMLIQTLRKWML